MAALLVGFIARLFGKYLEFVKPYIFSEDYKTVEAQDAGNEKIQYKNIIVIGREWSTAKHSTGSGKQINIVQTIIDIIPVSYTHLKGHCAMIKTETTIMTPSLLLSRV